MSENSLDYAQMIEIPVNTCTVQHKKTKRKKRRNDDLKKQLVEKVNKKVLGEGEIQTNQAEVASTETVALQKPKFNVVMLEFIIVCLLCAAIFLYNIFIPNSGINTFLKNTFMSKDTQVIDTRNYNEFTATMPVNAQNVTVEDGVMTLSGSLSVYAPCDGVVSSVVQGEDGLFVMEISHNDKFKTIISGAKYAYYKDGDTVYGSLPVAYIDEGSASIYMYNDGSLVTDYTLDSGSIIWQV